MRQYQEQLEQLAEIRDMMATSTRFMSLSGLSGISAGIVALLGAGWVYQYLKSESILPELVPRETYLATDAQYLTLLGMAMVILLLAVGAATFFTVRNTRRKGQSIWTPAVRRLFINLMLPLVAGGMFCIILAWHGFSSMVPGATLIFYGMALLNAGKYTLREIRYLGISEIVLGLIASVVLEYSIIFWALGFGVLHILYGGFMYYTYER